MEMATAMADGDGDGNGQQQGWWQWQWLMAMQQRWPWQWLTVTTTAMTNGDVDGRRRWRWQRSWQRRQRWQRWLQWWQPWRGQQWQKKGCLLCRQCAALWQGRHVASTPMETKESVPALRHGGDTAKSVYSPPRGRVPDSSPWILFLFIIYIYCSVYWTTLCLPPALFRRSRTLSAHWRSTSSTPPRTPSAYWQSTPAPITLFVKVSPDRACNDHNLTFLCWCEMTNFSATFFISQTFALSLTDNTMVIWKLSVVIVETFKVKIYLVVLRHFPAQPFCLVLVLAFAWQFFSSLHLHLVPFLGSSIVLQLQYWSLKFWKSTVLDSAKPFGWICFLCYIALSILSTRVHLKERVVAL